MKKLIAGLVLFAASAEGVVGVDSGLTSLYVSGNEIFVTNASSNTVKAYRFSPPSTLAQIGLTASTDQEPVFVAAPNPYLYVVSRKSRTLQSFIVDDNFLFPLGSVPLGFDPTSATVRIPHIFAVNAGTNTLQALDVSCNSRPSVISQIKTASNPVSVLVDGRYAYVTCLGEDKLQIFDVGRLRWGISLTGSVKTDEGPAASFVSGANLFVVNTIANTLQSFNISNRADPKELHWVRASISPTAIAGSGSLVFTVCRHSNVLEIFDVSNPSQMVLLHRLNTDFGPTAVVVSGSYAYVATYRMLQVFDVSDPLRKIPSVAASIVVH